MKSTTTTGKAMLHELFSKIVSRYGLLFLLMTIPTLSVAQTTVTLGTGTTTGTTYPIYTCYGYNYSQQIYLGSEIAAGGGSAGQITSIRFFYASGGTTLTTWNNWTVYLGNTTLTTFATTSSWVAVGSMTQVFSGTITAVAGNWITLTLSTPFNYTGGNLVVAVDENSASYSCTAAFRSYTYTGGARRAILYYNDTTNPNPSSPPTATVSSTTLVSQFQFVLASGTPCSGTPTAGTPSATPNSSVGIGTSVSLASSGVTSGTGMTYQWQSSSNNSTWTNITGATTSGTSIVFSSTVTQYYRLIATCTNSSLSATSSSVTVTASGNMNMPASGTYSLCSGMFYDSGGPSAAYGASENRTITISPATAGSKVRLSFSAFDSESCCDSLLIYNGPTIASPALHPAGGFKGTTSPGTLTSTATNGELTIRFISDGSIQNAGWTAAISCLAPCSGTPISGTTSGPTTAAYNETVNLTNTGFSTATGMTFQWQRSNDNSTWTNISNQTNAASGTNAFNTTSNRYYRLASTCSNSGLSSNSNSIEVNYNNNIWMPNNVTFTQCSGSFFDANGPSTNYANNELNVMTLVPSITGQQVQVNFNSFSLENGVDVLRVYDGPDTFSTAIHSGTGFTGSNSPGLLTATTSGGQLTFVFYSNSTTRDVGWDASMACVTNCTGTPTAGTITPASLTPTLGQTVALSSPGLTQALNIAYQWQSSLDNSSWSNISGATAMTYSYTHSFGYTRYFRLVVTCNTSGQSATSGTSTISYGGLINMPVSGSLATCNTRFCDSGGPSAAYGVSESRVVTFIPSIAGNKISATFTLFDTESCCDYLEVYDGPSTLSPALHPVGGFRGTTLPGSFLSTASGGELTFRFISDGSVQNAGWDATIGCVAPCSGTPSTGVISASSTLAGNGQPITFTQANVPTGNGLVWQWQSSTDNSTWSNISGATTAASTIQTFSSSSSVWYRVQVTCTNSTLTGVSNVIQVNFNNTWWMPISGNVTTCSGTLYDSGGPSGAYGNTESRVITFVPSTPGMKMQLQFNSFNTEAINDLLRIYNGPSTLSPPLHSGSGFSGTTSPGIIFSSATNGELTVEFSSSAFTTSTGWEAFISCGLPCSGNPIAGNVVPASAVLSLNQTQVLVDTGYSVAPGITYQWQTSTNNSSWTNVSGGTSPSLSVTFTTLSTQFYRLAVTCSNSSNTTYSGVSQLSFDGNVNMPQSGTFSLCSANFYDSGGPSAPYGPSENRTFTISPSTPGSKVRVNFTSFDVESGFEYLTIYNGPSTLSPPLHTGLGFTGFLTLGSFTSTAPNGELTFGFTSDGIVQNAGWVAQISCQSPCSGQPTISSVSADQTICYGSPTTLTVSGVQNNFDITYQWQRSSDNGITWTNVAGATGLQLNIAAVTTALTYKFTATCANGPVTGESSPVSVSISGIPQVYASLPYSQNFENWSNFCVNNDRPDVISSYILPVNGNNAWRRHDQGLTANWTNSTFGGYTPAATLGVSSARYHSYFQADSGEINFYVDCSITGTKTLQFDYRTDGGNDVIKVLYSTNGGSTFIQLGSDLTTTSGWVSFNQVLPSTSATTIVKLRAVGNASNSTDIGIDNLVISVPCTGTPSGGTVPAWAGNCINNGAIIVATNASAGSGITYQWQEFNGSSWISAVGGNGANTTTYITPALTVSKQYRLSVTCTNSTLSATGPSVTASAMNCAYSITRQPSITYTSIVGNGGTPVTNWTGTSTDDNYSNAIPIGFDFFYKGLMRTNFSVSTNGWMDLTGNPGGTYYSNISTALTQSLMPFWEDLVVIGNNFSNLNSTVFYQVSGTAPNRVLTVEWLNMETFANAGPNLNFQVKIFETTQQIQFLYGTMEGFDGSSNYTFSYSVGVVGNSGSDYQFQIADNLQNFSSVTTTGALISRPVNCNSGLTFTDGSYSVTEPVVTTPPAFDSPTNAVTLTVNNGPCNSYCGTYYTARYATASTNSGLPAAVSGTTASGDVFFSFTTSSLTDYMVRLRSGGGYDGVVQLLNSSLGLVGSFQVNATGTGLTETINANGLTPNTLYYVRVYNALGGTGTDGSFSICVNAVIPPPVNDNPAGAIALTLNTSCVNTGSPQPNVLMATASTGYTACTGTPDDDVWYSFVATVTNPIVTVSSGTGYNAVLQIFTSTFTSLSCIDNTQIGGTEVYSGSGLTLGQTYFIRIYHSGTGVGSGNFNVCVTGTVPACPGSANPTNNTAGVSLSQITSWAASPSAINYDVYLSTNQSLINSLDVSTRVSSAQTLVSYSPVGLQNASSYYWRVIPRNNLGANTTCTAQVFHTIPAVPSSIISSQQTVCSGGQTTLSVLAQGGSLYWFTSNCDSLIGNAVGTGNVLQVTPGSTTQYFARGLYQGSWSAGCSQQLITRLPLLAGPSGLALSGSSNCSGFTLAWNTLSGAAYYELDLATDALFQNYVGIYQSFNTGNVTNTAVSGLTPGTLYYARIRGVNTSGSVLCPGQNSSSTSVTTATIPVTIFNVTGGGIICGTGTTSVSLSGSDNGVVYDLYRNGTTLVASLTGNGSPLNFSGLTQAGTYGVIAQINQTGCTSAAMSGTASVMVYSNNLTASASGLNESCRNSYNGSVSLNVGGGSGSYAYSWSNGRTTLQNTGLRAGTYTVQVNDQVCTIFTPANTSAVVSYGWGAEAGVDVSQCSGSTINRNGILLGTVTSPVYTWFRPNGSQLGNLVLTDNNLTQPDSGQYVLRIVGGGCTSTDTFLLTVNSPVGGGLTANSNTPVCENSTLNLSGSQHTGATYLWNGPNGYSSTLSSPNVNSVTTNHTGLFTYRVTVPGCGLYSSTTAVVINPIPTPVVNSNTPVCGNSTLNLSGSQHTNGTYLWSGPNGYSSTLSSPFINSVTLNNAGVYTYLVTVPGCGVYSSTAGVIVNLIPTIVVNSNTPVCENSTLNLSGSQHTNATYLWSGPNGYSSTVSSPVLNSVTTNLTGVFTYRVTVPGCGVYSSTTSVVIAPTPLPVINSNTPVCENSTLFMSTATVTGYSYNWSGPGGYTSNLPAVVFSQANINQGGVYTLSVSNQGCTPVVQTVTTQVNQMLGPVTAQGNTPLCSGETLRLTALGGLQNSVYAWTGPNGFTSSQQNGILTPIQKTHQGTFTLTVTSPGCNTMSNTLPVTVIPFQPVLVTNTSPVCEGSPLFFDATYVANTLYSWSGPNGYTWVGRTPSINQTVPSQTGIYTVSVTQPGCQPIPFTTSVNVGQLLVQMLPTTNSPVCLGDTLRMQVASVTGVTYSWAGPNGYTGNQNAIAISNAQLNQAGTYTLTAITPGCGRYEHEFNTQVNNTPVLNAYAAAPMICEGGNLDLYAGGNNLRALYRWDGPNGFTSTQSYAGILGIRPLQAGVYSVIMTVQGCSQILDTVQVFVPTNISQLTGGTNTPVCGGNTLTLSATSYSGATYLWAGPGGFTANTAVVNRTNATAQMSGLYSLTVSSGNCTPVFFTYPVTVSNSGLAGASSNSPVCGGANLTLQGSGPRGSSYLWTGPNGYSSRNGTEILVNAQPAQTGIYSLIVTIPSCGSLSFTTSVAVGSNLNNSAITTNLPVCSGNTFKLTATPYSDALYDWAGPNGFTSFSSNDSLPAITTLGSGNYSVIISTPGCLPVVRNVIATILPPLSVTASANSPVCQGNNLFFNSNQNTGVLFSWTGPNGFTSNSPTPSLTNVQPNQSGTYALSVSMNGCGVASTSVAVQVGADLSSMVATSNSPVCAGQTLNVSATVIPNVVYVWAGPNGYTGSGATSSVVNATRNATGNYTLTVSSPGCGSLQRQTLATVDTIPVITPSANTPLCQGGTLQLSTPWALNSSIRWDGPNGFSSALRTPSISNVQPLQSGVYSLRVTTNCGIVSATVPVTVNPGLGGINISVNNPVCTGQVLRLSTATVSGYSYLWSGPNGFTSSNASDSIVNVNTNAGGVYTLQVNSSTCGSSTLTTAPVIVTNVASVVASGNTPICQGGTLQLNAGQMTGTTYSWSGPGGFTNSLRAPSVINITPTQGGVYTLNASVPGCGVVSSTVNIAVGSSLTGLFVSSNAPICLAGTLRLTVAPARSGYVYSWSGPSGFTSSNAVESIVNAQVSNSGLYSVTVTSPGCGSTQLSTGTLRVVDPSTLTASGNTPVCVGGTLNLVAPSLAGVGAYVWNGPGGFQSNGRTATRFAIQLSQGGQYSLTASMPGCGIVSTTVAISVVSCKASNPTATAESTAGTVVPDAEILVPQDKVSEQGVSSFATLTAWPNPNEGSSVNLKWEGLSEMDATITLKVYDSQGKVVFLQSLTREDKSSLHAASISFGQVLPAGQYIIESIHDGSRQYVKLIVE